MKKNISANSLKLNVINQKKHAFFKRVCPILYYGLEFGFNNAKKLIIVRNDRKKWMDMCYEIVSDEFSYFIKNYEFKQPTLKDNKIIWICWLQGADNMPDVVKICINSIIKNAPNNVEIKVLDHSTLSKYISIPENIEDLFLKRVISPAHYSDVARMLLLKEYGGIWIDSTLFVSGKIPAECFDLDVCSIQNMNDDYDNMKLYYGSLTSFLIGGKNTCAIFDFIYCFFVEYLKHHKVMIDGHWMNIAFRIAYENNICGVKRQIDLIGDNNIRRNELHKIINDIYDCSKYEKITSGQIFHKMNWRDKYIEKIDGQKTCYGYLSSLYKDGDLVK